MEYRRLGDSDVEVSEVGFGAWVVGTDWWGDRSEEDAREMVRYAIDRGVTYLDTGDVYGHGRSEKLIGEAIADVREDVTLATKVGYDFYNHPRPATANFRRRWIRTTSARPSNAPSSASTST